MRDESDDKSQEEEIKEKPVKQTKKRKASNDLNAEQRESPRSSKTRGAAAVASSEDEEAKPKKKKSKKASGREGDDDGTLDSTEQHEDQVTGKKKRTNVRKVQTVHDVPALSSDPTMEEPVASDADVMSKTYAMKQFKLSDEDIMKLPHEYRTNPHSRFYAPMCIFKVADLREAALKKYGGVEEFEEALEKSEHRGEKVRETRSAMHLSRKEELVNALEKAGLELPAHSKLCEDWIAGQSHGDSLAEVVETVKRLDVLHNQCEFQALWEWRQKNYARKHEEVAGKSIDSDLVHLGIDADDSPRQQLLLEKNDLEAQVYDAYKNKTLDKFLEDNDINKPKRWLKVVRKPKYGLQQV